MNEPFRRNFWISAAVHVAVVLVLLVGSLIVHWRVRKKKPDEMITFVDFQSMAPEAPQFVPVEEIKPPPPAPKPKDIPVPKDVPKPKPKKKKVIKKSTERVRRENEAPPQPRLSEEEIKKLLDTGQAKPTRTTGQSVPFAWYYSLVRQTMYEAWDQPSGLAASGLRAQVSIRVERDGRITRRELVAASNNSLMDDSVMKAVRSVTKLRPLPKEFTGTYKDITVEFELTGLPL